MSDIKVRKDRKQPSIKKYPFELLEERGDSIFIPIKGIIGVRYAVNNVRQAARSYDRHHTEIGEVGDTLRTSQEKEDGVNGAGVYRVAKED